MCLPVRKTGAEAPLRRRHHRKSIGAELDFTRMPIYRQQSATLCAAVLLYNLHSLTDALLRGLVQHVLSPRRSDPDYSAT